MDTSVITCQFQNSYKLRRGGPGTKLFLPVNRKAPFVLTSVPAQLTEGHNRLKENTVVYSKTVVCWLGSVCPSAHIWVDAVAVAATRCDFELLSSKCWVLSAE